MKRDQGEKSWQQEEQKAASERLDERNGLEATGRQMDLQDNFWEAEETEQFSGES